MEQMADPLREGQLQNVSVIYDEKSQRMADQMARAEAQLIAQRKLQEQDCDCKDGMFPRSPPSTAESFCLPQDRLPASQAPRQRSARKRRPAQPISTFLPTRPRYRAGRSAKMADMAVARNSRLKSVSASRPPTRTHLGALRRCRTCSGTLPLPVFTLSAIIMAFRQSIRASTCCSCMAWSRRQKIHDGRSEALSQRNQTPFHRMLGERADGMEQADIKDCAGYPWSAQHVGMDRRAVRHNRARGWPQGRRHLGAGRRLRRRGHDAQHPARKNAEGRVACLRPERRSDPTRAGLSVALAAARL